MNKNFNCFAVTRNLYLVNLNLNPMNRKVIFWAVITALGGFLFGFDTVVVSGAEQAIQQFWHLGDFQHGFTIAIALVGTMMGAFLGRMPADRMGRKAALMIVAI